MSDVELQLPPDVAFIGLARLVVVAAARQTGMADERVEDLRTAVSEAVTNAVVAHQRAGQGERVRISFGPRGDDGFEVTIADAGPGFEPQAPAELGARDWSVEGGLGVTVIRGLADDVRFIRAGWGMAVSMRFGPAFVNGGAADRGSGPGDHDGDHEDDHEDAGITVAGGGRGPAR